MNVDDLLRRAADDVRSGVASMVPPPRRRSRYGPAVVGATLVAVVAVTVGTLILRPGGEAASSSAARPPSTTSPPTTVVTSSSSTSSTTTSTTPTASTAAPGEHDEPVAGWTRTFVDDGVFGSVVITDAVATPGAVVATGCVVAPADPPGLSIWHSEDGGATWVQASGPAEGCVNQLVDTPFGVFAAAGEVLRSTDGGRTWSVADGGTSGRVQAIGFAGGRVVAITSTASLNESTVAAVLTSIDGERWTSAPASVAALFDNAEVAHLIGGGPGLIAVGSSPGGQFVPTAAVWVTSDGMDWRRVTPTGPGFDGAWMTDVVAFGDGYVAVGVDDLDTSLMAAWTSPNGVSWTRSPPPIGDVAAVFGSMGAGSVTVVGESLHAAGSDFDAAREETGDPVEVAAMWMSVDGVTWRRDTDLEWESRVPFARAGGLGFWPPDGWIGGGPVMVFSEAGG